MKASMAHPISPAPNSPRQRNPQLDGLLAVIDLVLAYLFLRSALDTGSLLQYGVFILALVLGLRSLINVIKTIRHRKERRL